MAQTVFEFTDILGSVLQRQFTLTVVVTVLEKTFVTVAVCIDIFAFAVFFVILEAAYVAVAVRQIVNPVLRNSVVGIFIYVFSFRLYGRLFFSRSLLVGTSA